MIGMIVATLRPRADEVQLIVAHVLERQLVWRDAVMDGKVGDGADVDRLCQWRHVADRHVLDHALAQWCGRLRHGMLPSVGLLDGQS